MLCAQSSLRRAVGWRFSGLRLYAKRSKAATPDYLSADEDNQEARRAELLKTLNAKFGKGTTWSLNDAPAKMEMTSSGCLTLDLALGGGYPKGRIIEIFGPESTGKSTLALHAIAEAQKAGLSAFYIDAENAFDADYAKKLGVKSEGNMLILAQPGCGDDALSMADHAARSGVMSMIVIDSVSALTPRSEIEGEIGAPTMGGQARLMSSGLRRLVQSAARMKCTIIFINQLRSKVGVIYGSPETTSGGQALKYYASMRIDLRKREVIEAPAGPDGGKDPIGVRIRAKVVKNKCAPPSRVAEFDLMYGSGINALANLLDLAQTLNVVTTRGAWYYYDTLKLAQGRENTLAALKKDPELLQKIDTRTREELALKNTPAPGDSMDDADALGESDREFIDDVDEAEPDFVPAAQAAR